MQGAVRPSLLREDNRHGRVGSEAISQQQSALLPMASLKDWQLALTRRQVAETETGTVVETLRYKDGRRLSEWSVEVLSLRC